MTSPLRSLIRGALPAGFATAALIALAVPSPALAQRPGTHGDVILSSGGDPSVPNLNLSALRRSKGFQLFAGGDAAGVGGHGTGNFSFATDNYGPCDAPLSGFCNWVDATSGVGNRFQFFEVLFGAAAPPSEWRKIKALVPAAANAKGGGYTEIHNYALFSGRAEWGPRDNTLGSLFSGVTSTSDGGCRDNTGFANGYFPTGLPLLAESNCAETWPNGVWKGDRNTTQDAYLKLFAAQGNNFTFNYWQVPDSLKSADPFLGSNFSTYGETSDHYADILTGYGSAVPGGTGDPKFDGWPLGLIWHFEMYNFGLPALASVEFYRATVINRSQDVWGVPIDYDSLYIGFEPGTGGSPQAYSDYYIPSIGTALYHQSDVTTGGPCADASRSAPAGVSGCAAAPAGYLHGGNAIIVLKSPIGDLRNKLFSETASGSPCTPGIGFCDPTHPLAGDTITFNHGHICGYGGCWANVQAVSDKRSFGLFTSQADVVRDGQTLIPGSEAWRIFHNADYPAVLGHFNKMVPGNWDYNHDGVQDTLYLDTCGSDLDNGAAPQGCVVTDADTMPGGLIDAYGNVGGTLSAGPFPLKAGDSTSWVVAFVGDRDSATTWADIHAAIDFYMNFDLGPVAPPPAAIVSTQVTAATDALGNVSPQVSLYFSDAPEKWADPFLTKVADDIQAAPAGTPYGDLKALNPGLEAEVRARATNNLEQIEIYKSCDGGGSWTSTSDCVGNPAASPEGSPVGVGWQAYAVLNVDKNNGDIPNVFTDNNVQAGRTYLYTFVGKSRGLTLLLDTPTGPDSVQFAPSIRNPLSRSTSDPNVASVYIPASHQAGFQSAKVSYNQQGQGATVPFELTFSDSVTAGNYKALFGNTMIVSRDSLISSGEAVQTKVTIEHMVTADVGGVPTPKVIKSSKFTRSGSETFPVAGTPNSTGTTTIGDTVRTTDTYNALGFVLVGGTEPFFGSTSLSGNAATPTAVFALHDFPGFTIRADNSGAGNNDPNAETALRGSITKQRLGTTADTVTRADVNQFMVQWREQTSHNTADGIGIYEIDWKSDAFGLPNGIQLTGDVTSTEAQFDAGLASRTVGLTGATDAATADLLGFPQTDLVAVKAPFTVRNTTFNRDVTIAMLRRQSNTFLLGNGSDTVRVNIQPDQWVPGDHLFFIENVKEDSTTANGVVLGGGGQPIQVTHPKVTFTTAVLGCDNVREACNPVGVGSRGETGYLPVANGDKIMMSYLSGFTPSSVYDFDMVGPVEGKAIKSVTDSALAEIRVVPNPYVVYSLYTSDQGNPAVNNTRVMFTNLPPTGTLRIYSVSGQFLQQIDWTPSDLSGAGDLFWDLKSREGIDVATGLYIWVLTAPSDPTNPSSTPVKARGKFVLIRGHSQ